MIIKNDNGNDNGNELNIKTGEFEIKDDDVIVTSENGNGSWNLTKGEIKIG